MVELLRRHCKSFFFDLANLIQFASQELRKHRGDRKCMPYSWIPGEAMEAIFLQISLCPFQVK